MSVQHSDARACFGATGDPACRQILPSLQAMIQCGSRNVPVIGVAKTGWNNPDASNPSTKQLK